MNLKGLKINFLGDSITEGHGCSSEEKRFTDKIAAEYGAITRCYGIGGTRLARQTAPSGNPRHDLDFPSRVAEMDPDADVVVVFGGTNDFGHGDAPLGTFADRTPYTFYGACHHIMTRMHERFPGKPMVILTPLHRLNEDNPKGDGNKAYNVAPLKVYVNIIREVAEFYSIPVLDLYAESGIQPKVDVIRERYCPDGLHPNDAGHELLAKKIFAYLKAM